MRMKIWIVLLGFVRVIADDNSGKTEYNLEPYRELCSLLKIAVGNWVEVQKRDPSDPLKRALGRTIFGSTDGGSLDDLKGLPADYTKGGAERGNFCGQPYSEPGYFSAPHRWSGHSAPHNLVCLCTKGENGYPVNISENHDTLCGKTSDALGAGTEGWTKSGSGKTQMEATWKEVVTHCLDGEVGKDLQKALKTFTGNLVNKPEMANPNRYQLGYGEPGDVYTCTGSPPRGVCVMYYNSTDPTKPQPWWSDLEKAIKEDEVIQEQKRLQQEEKRKKEEEAARQDSPKAEVPKSTLLTTNNTEESNKDNLTDTIRKFNIKSGTPITPPSTWLLSAAILI
ncbi:Variant surface glycoprotein [Trypanosoma congolense IL3000]|uniref:Variant surface glycoprotein n=1 Tax=Trypanosoma congolense (strain IL3000) TaxID=1068625 RepID=F9WFI8_TRYCI|nr:Variant surface glycoprotein [Trypanosoma congolense IL3000]